MAMDEICLDLLVDSVTVTLMTTPTNNDDQPRRLRRHIDVSDDRCVRSRISLISLFLAAHNDSILPPPTTTATTHSNVTETPTLSPASLIAEKFGESVTFGLLPTVAVIGLIVNIVALVVIAGDTRCPPSWRVLRCFAVVIDVVLLTLFMIVVDVVAYVAVTSLDVNNALAAVVGFLQYVQPWTLYITATYIHHLLLDERHKVPPQRRVRCPLAQLIAMIVAGAVYFTLYIPPIRLLLYRGVPGHWALCTMPLFDQWRLTVGLTATTDLFYYLCYDCLYAFVVYIAPIVPLFYRYRRLVDAIFRRDYESVAVRSSRSSTALCSWADVISVMCGVHIITHCIKSTLLAMRLGEAIAVEKFMAAGDVVFQLMNSLANLTVTVRPLCHLPVMLIYDRRLRTMAVRQWRTTHAALVTVVGPYVRCGDQSEYSDESIELDSVVVDDDQLDDVDDVHDAVPV